MNSIKILAVIIVYNPDINLLLKNINALIENVHGLLIWNNSPNNFDANSLVKLDDKIIVNSYNDNIGISKALNIAWHYAKDIKFVYLLTMDQDSVWINFKGFLEKFYSFADKVNIFGPEYDLQNNVNSICEREYRITSGMLVALELLDKSITDNPVAYPSKEVLDKTESFIDLGDTIKVYDKAWIDLKSK